MSQAYEDALRIPLLDYKGAVQDALFEYQRRTSGAVCFDLATAAGLEPTPDQPFSAASESDVTDKYASKIGTLLVVVFAGHEGNGGESAHHLSTLSTNRYFPLRSAIVPRVKADGISEAHITLFSDTQDESDAIVPFAGRLDILGLRGLQIAKIGSVGQSPAEFQASIQNGDRARPTATYTAGHRPGPSILGEQFGNPHAIINPYDGIIQVCGFIAVADEEAFHLRDDALKSLHTRLPRAMPVS